jgi:molybdopterin-guanine dinucleotide biosynthesis protein A
MGRDKALLVVEGRPLAGRVAHALETAGAARVEAVGGDGPALVAAGLVHRADRWPGEGPLGGIVTALTAPGAEDVVVVAACDLVAPDPSAVRHLVERLLASGADVAVPVVDGRHQWLHAAWQRRVAGVLCDLFAAGERSVAGAVLGLRVLDVGDLPAAALHDADRPEDIPPDARYPSP